MGKRTYFLKDSDTYQVLFTGLKEEAKALISDVLAPFIQPSPEKESPLSPKAPAMPPPSNWSYPTLESIPFQVSPPVVPNKQEDVTIPVKGSEILFK